MVKMRRFLSINAVVLTLVGFCAGQDNRPLIEVKSAVDTSRITIGDRITYTLSIDHVDTMRVEKPGEGVNLGQFEIKDYKIYDPIQQEGRIQEKFEYVISVFDTGAFVIPPFPVAYFPTDSLRDYKIIEASPITIYVESVIQDEERELRDVEPPIDIPYNYLVLISIISSVLLIGAMLYFGYRLYKKRKETGYLIKPPQPPRPAHEIALAALEELINKDLLSSGLVKEFYSEISELFRRYIEGRYFIPALEETSGEILKELSGQDIVAEIEHKAKEILDLSDLVKFAKYKPVNEENQKVVELTREFIEKTMVIYAVEETPEINEVVDTDEIGSEEEKTAESQSTQSKSIS
jgi:hypothetical protein